MKRLATLVTLFVLLASSARAQVAIPNTLSAGAVIRAGDLNTNFTTLGNHALDRLSGGTISGNVTLDPGVTIDGIDIGATVCTTCAPTFKDLTLSSPATGLTVGGTVIINTAGKIPAISSTYFASVDGSALTNLAAGNIATGTVGTARLGSGSATSSSFLRGDSSWVNANQAWNVVGISGSTAPAIGDLDEVTGGSGITVTLPAASGCTASNNRIGLKNDTTNVITVARTGTDTIDGATSFSSAGVQYESYDFVCNAAKTGWMVR